MPKRTLLERLRRPPISYEEFGKRHPEAESVLEIFGPMEVGSARTLAQLVADPPRGNPILLPSIMEALKDHPFFQLLRAAARENCPDAYNIYLYQWLARMRVAAPEGVFKEPRGRSGRRRNQQTTRIYETWLELGCPTLGSKKLAWAVFGPSFTTASSVERKKMVDRCRRAVERTVQLMRLNSEQL
jgi:hypothetical protein